LRNSLYSSSRNRGPGIPAAATEEALDQPADQPSAQAMDQPADLPSAQAMEVVATPSPATAHPSGASAGASGGRGPHAARRDASAGGRATGTTNARARVDPTHAILGTTADCRQMPPRSLSDQRTDVLGDVHDNSGGSIQHDRASWRKTTIGPVQVDLDN